MTAFVEKLEAWLNKNSGNSSKPLSPDDPFKKSKSTADPNQKGKAGAKKGYKALWIFILSTRDFSTNELINRLSFLAAAVTSLCSSEDNHL